MSRRNVANLTTLNDIYLQRLSIQSSGEALTIFSSLSTTPVYVFNPNTLNTTISGNLTVTGAVSFGSIDISSISSSILNMANPNAADVKDIGISGYHDTTQHSGLVRQASDTLKRWTFYDGITTAPTTVVTGINSGTLASVRMNNLYVNDGTVTNPAIVFDTDTTLDTGFYRVAENTIGIATGGANIVSFKPAGADFTNGAAVNIGTSGTTSSLNVYGASTINGNLTMAAGVVKNIITNNTNTIVLSNIHNVVESSFVGAVTITLPDVTTNVGRQYTIIKISVSGTITINTTGGQTIDNGVATSVALPTQYDRVVFIGGSTQWYTL